MRPVVWTTAAMTVLNAWAAAAQVFVAPSDFDATFGAGGIAHVDLGAPPAGEIWLSAARQEVLLPDGRILAAGDYRTNAGDVSGALVAVLLTNGSADTRFGGGKGVVRLGASTVRLNNILGLGVQTDGKYLVTGQASYPAADRGSLYLLRLDTDGSLDGTFGSNGTVYLPDPRGTSSSGNAVLQTRAGQFVTAGFQYDGPDRGRGMVAAALRRRGGMRQASRTSD